MVLTADPRLPAILLMAALAEPAGAAEIRVEAGPGAPHRVSALRLSAAEREDLSRRDEPGLAAALRVFTGNGVPSAGTPAIVGEHTLDGEGLHFRPRFPFVPGLDYTASFGTAPGAPPQTRTFAVAAAPGPPPQVVAVFPSGDVLPANTLRLYLHFSQPMEAHFVHRQVRLLDDRGVPVTLAFVEIEHGLWDPRQTRLTLLFHPGRVKRGVAPGEALGPPLVEGREYRLVVSGALADRAGRPLGRDFERRFRAGGPDRESPSAARVRVTPPASPDSPVVVDLPEPLDEGLLRRLITVADATSRAVTGEASVAAGEMRWVFAPATAWAPGAYSIRMDPALEDLAGNRFDRLFDRPAAGRDDAPTAPTRTLDFPFRVEGGSPAGGHD